tara:strand:- start:1805 stop:2020 length:216 start_codon:yes stop_codon:yes gene_type:complete
MQQKQTLKALLEQHPDTQKYDAVVFIGLSGVNVSNIGIAGALPEGADPKRYLFAKLQEAQLGIAFSGDSGK